MIRRTFACVLAVSFTVVLSSCGDAKPAPPAAHAPLATNVTLRYAITGMHCDGCVEYITDKVTKVDGVVSCKVSLETNEAEVVARSADVAPKVEEAITKGGYKVERK